MMQNGPIDIKKITNWGPEAYSFLETETKTTTQTGVTAAGGDYTKAISVQMKLSKDPDPKIKAEIVKMDKKGNT